MKNKSQELDALLEEITPKEAAGILFKHANEVFLVKHTQLNAWVAPGGHMDPKDANHRDCAIREFREECGMLPGYAETHHTVVTESNGVKFTTFLYEPDTRFTPEKLHEESSEAQWFDFEQLPKDIYEPTAKAIKQFDFKRPTKPRGWK